MNMSHAFSKILISVIIVVLIGGGILTWQYLGIPQQEEKKILKEREEVTPEFIEPTKETIQVKLYFSNNKLGERKCESAFPVIRTMSQAKEIEEMAKITINELIKGPTEEEKLQGYYLTVGFPSKENIERHKKRMEEKGLDTSAFDDGVKIKSLEIKDGIVYIDFNIALNVGGNAIESCIITSIRTAVANILRQFSGIKDVVISVEGREWPCSDFDCVRKLEFEVGKSDIFIETAQSGEGITHLARRALDKYLKQISYIEAIELTAEQKVYIEDYLQNKIGSESLGIGESKEFSAELIREAVTASQSITQQELRKYLFSTSIETGIISIKGKGFEEDSATIWIQYLDQTKNLIPEAEVTLTLTSPQKYKYEVKFSKENNYYYVTLYYISMFKNSYCFQINAKKKIYTPAHKDFCINFSAYIDTEIQTGKFPINYKEIAKIQKSVDEGHQPWYLSPQLVAFDMARNYGFIEEDRKTMKNILLDTDTGIAKYEIIHKEKPYIITVIQPVPEEHKVWTLSEIRLLLEIELNE